MIRPLLLCTLLTGTVRAAPPAAGTLANPVSYERFTATGVANASLSEHAGKIIVLAYYAPW